MTTPYGSLLTRDHVSWDWVPRYTVPQTQNPLVVWLFSSEVPPHPRGGLGRHVDRLARYLVHRGHQVRMVAPFPDLGVSSPYSNVSQPEDHLPYAVWDVKDLPNTPSDFARESVVHVHDPTLWPVAKDFSERHKIPLVMTWHTLYGAWARALFMAPDAQFMKHEQMVIRESPHQIWVSHYLLDQAQLLYGPLARGTRHSVIGSGISFPSINGAHLPKGFPDILFIGRLEPEKGIDWLFEVLSGLMASGPPLQIVICGNGSWRTRIHQEIQDHGWQHQLHAVGMIGDEELNQYLMTAKMAVLPSRFEPFGLSALEAMSAGVATILGPAPGFREFAIPNQNCLVVKSPDELSRAIQHLLHNPQQRQQLAESAETLANPWHWSRIGAEIEREYYRTLECGKRSQTEEV